MSVVIFEDEKWVNFIPLASMRHLGLQIFGTESIVQEVAGRTDGEVSLWGRDYLSAATEEETKLPYNERVDGGVLLVNARINPLIPFEKMAAGKSDFALVDRDGLTVAAISRKEFESALSEDGTMHQRKLLSMAKGLERLESTEPVLFRYPWEMLALNARALEASGDKQGRSKLTISPEAEVEEFVTFDPSTGPIMVDERARIESFSRVSGPCYIGSKTVLRSALVRGGTTIGEDCRIGGEVDHSIVYPHTNKAHFGYLGHSIVGEWVNMGAGSATSDMKNTYGTVRVQRLSGRVDSGLQKLGPMIGDMAKTSIGSMIYGGKTVGISTHCAGLVDRDLPDFTSYDGWKGKSFALTLPSVTRSLKRMMERRGVRLTPSRKALIERLYAESRPSESYERKRP
ncbi:MAG: putative sugar nucleotidyl transferase [Nitrososphaerales archaeon]